VQAVSRDHREASLTPADRRMLDFAVKLTRAPAEVTEADLDGLRQEGFDDLAIHEIVQVTALFGYYNRLAEGLGVDPEHDHAPRLAARER
jgi:uncharacterized peroxidase-related enzyme